jgi:hypothetical protein
VVSVTGGYYPNYDEDEPAQMRMLSVMLAAAMFACTCVLALRSHEQRPSMSNTVVKWI